MDPAGKASRSPRKEHRKADDYERAIPILKQIQQLLKGQDPNVVAAVLMALMAEFVAKHSSDTPERTAEMREGILTALVEGARDGISDAESDMLTNLPPAGSG
jgi:hypothetical protein